MNFDYDKYYDDINRILEYYEVPEIDRARANEAIAKLIDRIIEENNHSH